MAAAAKSKAIEKDVDGLISSITGFSESVSIPIIWLFLFCAAP